MDTIKAANKIIKKGIELLPDEAKKDFMAAANKDITIDEAINNACGALNGDDEKIAMLKAWAVQEANTVVSALWRDELLTKDLEDEYRKLPKMVDVAAEYNKFVDARKARLDEAMDLQRKLAEEDRDLQIFQGIVNGVPADKAEKEYDSFKKQQQAALGAR